MTAVVPSGGSSSLTYAAFGDLERIAPDPAEAAA